MLQWTVQKEKPWDGANRDTFHFRNVIKKKEVKCYGKVSPLALEMLTMVGKDCVNIPVVEGQPNTEFGIQ